MRPVELRPLFVVLAALLLQACASGMPAQDLLDSRLPGGPTPSAPWAAKKARLDRFMLPAGRQPPAAGFGGVLRPGNDRLTGSAVPFDTSALDGDAEDVMLNLADASIPQAAKSVLGDIFETEYSVDNRVTGTVTLQTPVAISRRRLLELFEGALRANGAAIVADGHILRIVPLADAVRTTASLVTGPGDLDRPGVRPELVALRFVSAGDMREVLEPMLPQGMILRADAERNALVLSGTAREIAAIRETISVFDVDWMKGMSFALLPVRSSSPAAIVRDLEQIFNTSGGPLKGIVRFVPNARLKSVLVISARANHLKEAAAWIRKLDVAAESGEASLHVYRVQNRRASELARLLASILAADGGDGAAAEDRVAPQLTPTVLESPRSERDAAAAPETPPEGIDAANGGAEFPADQARPGGIRIVADDANNALLIYCSDLEFERIRPVLGEIDTVPNQVLLEAVIAEVSLDDDLKFGVRWFLGKTTHHGTFSDAATGAVSSVFPGFSYFLKADDIALALNAISSVTNVRVLSAPSLVVLDNRTATLQVGDQVPIVTQSAQSVSSPDAPIVANVELRDTGVILRVTPQVNDSGLVTLDIEQEVSSVVRTTTSGIDSPTIRQRRMKTSVVVTDSEALALGGLIQERETAGRSKVPVLGDVPVLGAAFRQKTDAISRTELIVFIRPRVIRSLEEARQVTREFRDELSIQAPRVRRGEPKPGRELIRIFN